MQHSNVNHRNKDKWRSALHRAYSNCTMSCYSQSEMLKNANTIQFEVQAVCKMVSIDYLLACYHRPTVNLNCYEVGMAESPGICHGSVCSSSL